MISCQFINVSFLIRCDQACLKIERVARRKEPRHVTLTNQVNTIVCSDITFKFLQQLRAFSPNAIVVNVEQYYKTSNRIVALLIDAFMLRNNRHSSEMA